MTSVDPNVEGRREASWKSPYQRYEKTTEKHMVRNDMWIVSKQVWATWLIRNEGFSSYDEHQNVKSV